MPSHSAQRNEKRRAARKVAKKKNQRDGVLAEEAKRAVGPKDTSNQKQKQKQTRIAADGRGDPSHEEEDDGIRIDNFVEEYGRLFTKAYEETKFEQALDYAKSGLDLVEANDSIKESQIACWFVVGVIDCYIGLEDYKSARPYAEKLIKLPSRNEDRNMAKWWNKSVGVVWHELGAVDLARAHFMRAAKMADEDGDAAPDEDEEDEDVSGADAEKKKNNTTTAAKTSTNLRGADYLFDGLDPKYRLDGSFSSHGDSTAD